MKPRTLKDLRKACTPDHIAALTRTATTHPDATMRDSAVKLLAALTTPDPKPTPRSPALLAELAAHGEVVRTTPEESLALMAAGASAAPAKREDLDGDAFLGAIFAGGSDRIADVIAARRTAAAERVALAERDPAGVEHADAMAALGLSELCR